MQVMSSNPSKTQTRRDIGPPVFTLPGATALRSNRHHQQMENEKFPEMARGMRRVTATACSHLSTPEQMRRLVIVLDAMYHSLANADVMTKAWKKNDHAAELDEHVVTLKRFLAGGLSASSIKD